MRYVEHVVAAAADKLLLPAEVLDVRRRRYVLRGSDATREQTIAMSLGRLRLWRALGGLGYRVALSRLPHTEVAGLEVILASARPTPQDLPRLGAALDLVGQHAPASLAWAQREGLRIVLVWKDSPTLVRSHRAISVGAEWLSIEPTSFAAMQLVAQIVKARVTKAAPRAADVRVERAAYEHRLTFCRRLPENEALLAFLTMAWDSGWVLPDSDQMREVAARRTKRTAETLEALRLPVWLRALLLRQFGRSEGSDLENPPPD